MKLKLIYEPTVYLLGRQQVVRSEVDRFLDDLGVEWATDTDVPGQELVEISGRACYESYSKPRPGGNKAYIDNILTQKHGSVTEMADWVLMFTGVSRSLTHELVRHRPFSYAMLSQRYHSENEAAFVVPPDLQEEVRAGNGTPDNFFMVDEKTKVGLEWISSVLRSQQDYINQVDYLAKKASLSGLTGTEGRKFARQAARSVLPNATETKIVVKGNARIFRHFIEMRASRHADPEIRMLACKVWEVLKDEAPNLFGDYEKVFLQGGREGDYELTTPFRKV